MTDFDSYSYPNSYPNSYINYDFLNEILPDDVHDLSYEDMTKMIPSNINKPFKAVNINKSHDIEILNVPPILEEINTPPPSISIPSTPSNNSSTQPKNIIFFDEGDWEAFDKEMGKLSKLDADYELIIADFRMRESARGRKPILFKKFKDAVPDLDDKEKGLKFLVDNPTFINQFKENIAQNNTRQKWVERRKKGEKRSRSEERDDREAVENEMEKLAREIVQKSLE